MRQRCAPLRWCAGHRTLTDTVQEEAEDEAWSNIELYTDFARDLCALAVVPGIKSPRETFAGAAHTYCIEVWQFAGWGFPPQLMPRPCRAGWATGARCNAAPATTSARISVLNRIVRVPSVLA